MEYWRWRSPKQDSINLWKVAGAFVRPNGILTHLYNPNGPTVKAVYGMLSSAIRTCQYPDFRSSDIKILAPFKQSSDSSIRGRLYVSLMVRLFNYWRSIQNLKPPSFFHTNTMGLAHGLVDLQMTPTLSISCRWARTSSNCCGGIHR